MTETGQCLRSSDTSMESVTLKQCTKGKSSEFPVDPTSDYSSCVDNDIIDEVDSEDILQEKVSNPENLPFYQHLLQRMNPVECLSPAVSTVASASFSAVHGCTTSAYKSCLSSDRDEFEFLLHDLLKDVRVKYIGVANHKSNARTAALQRLYRLTDREHAQNRVPAVCTTSFATIPALVTCLHLNVPGGDRRQALLIINNLCIPVENKAAIIFGEAFESLMDALLELIRERVVESYLALAALVNLTYIQDDHAKIAIFNHIPKLDRRSVGGAEAPSQYFCTLPGDSPLSIIRTLESLLQDYVPFVVTHRSINSVEQQCCRWSFSIIRNLTSSVLSQCLTVGKTTQIPVLAIQCLLKSDTTNLAMWSKDSLEDACLMILVHIFRIEDCISVLKDNRVAIEQLQTFCEKLTRASSGIHQLRAKSLLDRLEDYNCARSKGYSV